MGSQYQKRKTIPAQTLSFRGFQTIGHTPQKISLLLISIRGWVEPRNVWRPQGLYQLKITMALSVTEHASLRLVAQCRNQLRHRVLLLSVHFICCQTSSLEQKLWPLNKRFYTLNVCNCGITWSSWELRIVISLFVYCYLTSIWVDHITWCQMIRRLIGESVERSGRVQTKIHRHSKYIVMQNIHAPIITLCCDDRASRYNLCK